MKKGRRARGPKFLSKFDSHSHQSCSSKTGLFENEKDYFPAGETPNGARFHTENIAPGRSRTFWCYVFSDFSSVLPSIPYGKVMISELRKAFLSIFDKDSHWIGASERGARTSVWPGRPLVHPRRPRAGPGSARVIPEAGGATIRGHGVLPGRPQVGWGSVWVSTVSIR